MTHVDDPLAGVEFRETKEFPEDQVIALYTSMNWSSAEKPNELLAALANSHTVISAWFRDRLIGLGNALSDGHLVVYYPHLIVAPEFHKKGIGRAIMKRMAEKYEGLHQQVLVADAEAVGFYQKCGFKPAGSCSALWIYLGSDHD